MIPRRVVQDLPREPGARQLLDDQHGRPAVSAQRPTATPGPHSGTMSGASGTSLPSLPVHGRPLGRINEIAPIADSARLDG